MSPRAKFTVINILFYGFIGSLLGGVIPAIMSSWATFDSTMAHTDRLFAGYIVGSLLFGFLPASTAGFIYSRMYKKEYLKVGSVDFWRELKFGSLASLIAMLGYSLIVFALLLADEYATHGELSSARLYDGVGVIGAMFLFLIFLGVISGTACANLIREWNQKLAANLS